MSLTDASCGSSYRLTALDVQEQQTGRPVQAGGPGGTGSYSHPDGLDQGGTTCCGTCVIA